MKNNNCPACKTVFIEKVEFCSKCQFPFNGTEKEKAVHIGRFIGKKGVIADSSIHIKKSQNILYLVAGLNVISLIILITTNQNYHIIDLILYAFLALIFLLCGIFINKNPFRLVLIPLVLLLIIYSLNFIVNPETIAQGLLLKIFIVGSLIYSIYLQKSSEKFKKKYDKI